MMPPHILASRKQKYYYNMVQGRQRQLQIANSRRKNCVILCYEYITLRSFVLRTCFQDISNIAIFNSSIYKISSANYSVLPYFSVSITLKINVSYLHYIYITIFCMFENSDAYPRPFYILRIVM